MTVYLTVAEVRASESDISAEFEQLMRHPRVAPRPSSKQWRFLRHCFQVLLGQRCDRFSCDKHKAAQYKFEVEDRLSRFYLEGGSPVGFVFRMVQYEQAVRQSLIDVAYPNANGYALLVAMNDPTVSASSLKETKDLLARVVQEAIDAEWAVYLALPRIDLTPLDGVFLSGGPAYRRIQHNADIHKRNTICNVNNPSTKQLMKVNVKNVTPTTADVHTHEHIFLKWWDLDRKSYGHVYDEVSYQRYELHKIADQWLVNENMYPVARSTAPRRRRRK